MKLTTPVKDLVLKIAPGGDVTQWFAENPALYAQFDMKGHNGIDIVREWGSPMLAIEDGVVLDVKMDATGFGKHVRFLSNKKNSRGYYNEWTYGHCSSINVLVGDNIKKGQEIAKMGNTGFVVTGYTPYWKTNPYAGTHLHLGLREMERVSKGWRYEGSNIGINCINYENGYKGSIDPVPTLQALAVEVKVPDPTPKEVKIQSLQLQVIDALKALYNILKSK